MSTSSSPAIIPKVALTLTGEIANKEKEKTKTTQAPYLVLSECLSQPQGVRPIFVPKSMKVVVPNPAPMAVVPVLQPKSITFPNPVTDLAARYGPFRLEEGIYEKAWVGDRLLAFSVTIVLHNEMKMNRHWKHAIYHEIITNTYLSRLLPCNKEWYCRCISNSIHGRGTVVEALLAEAYWKDGLEAVHVVVRYMVTQSMSFHRMKENEGRLMEDKKAMNLQSLNAPFWDNP